MRVVIDMRGVMEMRDDTLRHVIYCRRATDELFIFTQLLRVEMMPRACALMFRY